MKKTILAAAALAAVSSAAFAQSSVTLYGVVDASVERVKGGETVSRVSSDNLATTRIGFKGVEDLGGGYKALFNLESGVKADTGAFGDSSRAFNRAAWAGVATPFGEVRIGRQDSSIGALGAAALGAQAYDELVVAGTVAGVTNRRIDNAITYVAPTFFPGLSAQVQYSTTVDAFANNGATPPVVDTAEALNSSDKGQSYGLSIAYANGPIAAGLGYINTTTDVAGNVDLSALLVYGSYDFGFAKVTGYYDQDKKDNAAEDLKLYGIKVAVPVTTQFSVGAGYAKAKDAKFTQGADASIYTLRAQYDLSKRTALYGLYTQASNSGAGFKVSGAPAFDKVGTVERSDQNSSGLAVGVRHSF